MVTRVHVMSLCIVCCRIAKNPDIILTLVVNTRIDRVMIFVCSTVSLSVFHYICTFVSLLFIRRELSKFFSKLGINKSQNMVRDVRNTSSFGMNIAELNIQLKDAMKNIFSLSTFLL